MLVEHHFVLVMPIILAHVRVVTVMAAKRRSSLIESSHRGTPTPLLHITTSTSSWVIVAVAH